jgi:hypothetical protein
LIPILSLIAAVALGLTGCAKKEAAPVAAVYPYDAGSAKAFYATSSGLSERTYEGETDPETFASQAPNASVLSSDGASIAVALNGWGVERIEAAPGGGSYRLVDGPAPERFAGLSTGGCWPYGGGFLVQLYRDPFSAAVPEAGEAPAAASRLVFVDGSGAAPRLSAGPFPPGIDPGFELFALLPSGSGWFAELRKDEAARVRLRFFAFDDPLAYPAIGTAPAREVSRAEFEAALKPRPLSSLAGELGASLRSALDLLGKGPWVARLRSAEGDDTWYLSPGDIEESSSALAWSLGGSDGGVIALCAEGRLAFSDKAGKAELLQPLSAPVEGAAFTAVAAAGGLVVAAWEAGEFPYVAAAGIIVAPLR